MCMIQYKVYLACVKYSTTSVADKTRILQPLLVVRSPLGTSHLPGSIGLMTQSTATSKNDTSYGYDGDASSIYSNDCHYLSKWTNEKRFTNVCIKYILACIGVYLHQFRNLDF